MPRRSTRNPSTNRREQRSKLFRKLRVEDEIRPSTGGETRSAGASRNFGWRAVPQRSHHRAACRPADGDSSSGTPTAFMAGSPGSSPRAASASTSPRPPASIIRKKTCVASGVKRVPGREQQYRSEAELRPSGCLPLPLPDRQPGRPHDLEGADQPRLVSRGSRPAASGSSCASRSRNPTPPSSRMKLDRLLPDLLRNFAVPARAPRPAPI